MTAGRTTARVPRGWLRLPRRTVQLRLPRRTVRLRLPRRTVRLRLAALYAVLFLVSGAGLLTMTYLLVAHQVPTQSAIAAGKRLSGLGGPAVGGPPSAPGGAGLCTITGTTAPGASAAGKVSECEWEIRSVAAEHHSDLSNLLIGSWVALAVMTVGALGLGWLMAGRVLRPLRTITSTARNISASNLHHRLALSGPDDELKELGDTFDGLLTRLEASFEAQRQFVANASHELRTPLARQRTLVEVALADPEPTSDALRAVCERVLAAGEQQERLIEALLTLARSQRGLDRWELIDLAAIAEDAVQARQREAAGQQLRVSLTRCGGDCWRPSMMGDARLTERLVANLVDNAVRYNVEGGWITVRVGVEYGQAVLAVANSGPLVPPGEVARLFAPFERLGASRQAGGQPQRRDGHGLGLSIVSAVAAAHGADLHAQALPDGGLDVRLKFPPLPGGALPGGPVPDAAVRTAVASPEQSAGPPRVLAGAGRRAAGEG